MNARRSVSTIGGILSSVGLVLAAPAWGQAVYRCGSSYGAQPCTEGRALSAADPRTPQQRAQADTAVLRDAALAESMAQARQREEARVEGYQPFVPATSAGDAASSAAVAPRPKGSKVFTARAPGESKKTGKKKRAVGG